MLDTEDIITLTADAESTLNVLLVSNDTELCEQYAQKSPPETSVSYVPFEPEELAAALHSVYPHAVFALFKKGEHNSGKGFDLLDEYTESNLTYLGVMGSRLQINSLRKELGEDAFTVISSPRMIREEMMRLYRKRQRRLAALRRYTAARLCDKPRLIAVVASDAESAVMCSETVTAYMVVNDRDFSMVFLDMRQNVQDKLSDAELIPDVFIFSDSEDGTAAKAINTVLGSPEYKKTPYILLDNGFGKSTVSAIKKKKPSAVIDIKNGGRNLAFKVDELLHRK